MKESFQKKQQAGHPAVYLPALDPPPECLVAEVAKRVQLGCSLPTFTQCSAVHRHAQMRAPALSPIPIHYCTQLPASNCKRRVNRLWLRTHFILPGTP